MYRTQLTGETELINDHVVLTKLFTPFSQDDLFPRPHLFQILTKGLEKNILIVTASAGYGKTSMVAEWSKTLTMSFGWLSLGKEDDSPIEFWKYFLHALHRINPTLVENTRKLFYSSQSIELEDIALHCINEITNSGEEFCLVIDNFEVLLSPHIHKTFNNFLKYPPPNMKIIILTKGMTDYLYEVSSLSHYVIQQDLFQFKGTELALFFEKFTQNLFSAKELRILENKTDGWITGMRFFCQTYEKSESLESAINLFSGTNPNVYQYFIERIFNKFDQDMQQFLLETSILDRMNASLCAAVTRCDRSEDYVTLLFKTQGFISPIDISGEKCYQYHYLFREAMLKKLKMERDGDISYLYQRASKWFYKHNLIEETIDYAILGKDFPFSTECLYQNGPQLIKERKFSTITKWISLFPNDWIGAQPYLLILNAWVLALQDESENAHSFIDRVEKQLPHIQNNAHLQEELFIDIEVIKGYIGIIERQEETALTHMSMASEKLPNYSRYFQIGIEYITGEGFFLHSNMAMGGELKRAYNLYSQLRQIWKNSGFPAVGYGAAALAAIHYEWNEFDKVTYFIKRGIHLGKTNQNLGILIPIYFTYACLQKRVLGREKMWEVLKELHDYMEANHPDSLWKETIKAFHIRLLIEENQLEKVQTWMVENKSRKKTEWILSGTSSQITMVRALAALNETEEALKRLEEQFKEAKIEQSISSVIELLIIKCLILHEQKETRKAQKVLVQAVNMGKHHQYIRTFIDEGPVLYRILFDFVSQNAGKMLDPYYELLLEQFEQEYGKLNQDVQENTLVEKLTKREIEVLNLLNLGYSNKEIASKLFLSVGTVKQYNNNIYSKLQAHNRTQALIRAKELEIL